MRALRDPSPKRVRFLTSAEAADRLGVSTSSIKRWVDDGTLVSERTAGGHRRLRSEVVEAFARRSELAPALPPSQDRFEPAPGDLLALLLSSRPSREIEARLIALRSSVGSVSGFADALAPSLREMGVRWVRGELPIADEHIATERLARALARMAEWIPLAPRSKVALLATAVEDEHTLGLSLAELCLREGGWDARWVGRRTPTDTLVDLISRSRREVRLVVLSASVVSSDAASLARQSHTVGAACAAAGATLLLGGDGAWPERPRDARRVRSMAEFERVAREVMDDDRA